MLGRTGKLAIVLGSTVWSHLPSLDGPRRDIHEHLTLDIIRFVGIANQHTEASLLTLVYRGLQSAGPYGASQSWPLQQ